MSEVEEKLDVDFIDTARMLYKFGKQAVQMATDFGGGPYAIQAANLGGYPKALQRAHDWIDYSSGLFNDPDFVERLSTLIPQHQSLLLDDGEVESREAYLMRLVGYVLAGYIQVERDLEPGRASDSRRRLRDVRRRHS